MGSISENLANAVPMGTATTLVTAGAITVALTPVYGILPSVYGTIAAIYQLPPTAANIVGGGLTLGLAPFFAAKILGRGTKKPKCTKYRGLRFGPVRASERDLFTSFLVLGATGSGKTSRILFPALEDLITTYNAEDTSVDSTNPYQKLGAFILEVKGKFFETIVYLVHQAGRNASTDVRVIRANSTLPVVEFRDEKGRRFYLNGQPCSTGSEVSYLYKPYHFSDGGSVESTLFKRTRSEDLILREDELKAMEVAVHDNILFISWRWREGKLHRVRQTLIRDTPEFTGEVIDPPVTLRYHRTIYVGNGLTYNLIDPKVQSSEAASRIAMVAKMVTGEGKGGGDNVFFYQAAAKAIDNSIRLFRIINPGTQVTVLDINRIITQDTAQQASIQKLRDIKNALTEKKIQQDKEADSYASLETGKLVMQYDDLLKWFTEEWATLKKNNTGSSIISTISNLFGPFMRDPNLQETFCRAASFSFDDCMQKGTIFAFVPGSEYELNARLLGTVLKMDWQSRMLQRVSEGSDTLNKNRIILGVADECQAFIISGSQDAGDPKFMSLSRESKIINMAATQSEAWVYTAISRDEARVWLQSFRTRVWLTQTDIPTNEEASKLCGRIKVESRTSDENINLSTILSGDGTAKQKFEYKEKPRFESHEFTQLSEDEAIVFNNGEGFKDANIGDNPAMKGKVPWRFITSPEGVAAVAERMRWWAVENWENELFASKRDNLLDPRPPQLSSNLTLSAPPSKPKEESSGNADAAASTTSSTAESTEESPFKATPAKPETAPVGNTNPQGLNPNLELPGTVPVELIGLPTKPLPNPKEHPAALLGSVNSATQPEELNLGSLSKGGITPAQIAAQSAAYENLIANNPFILVEYDDVAGITKSTQTARQSHEIPKEEKDLVGDSGHVGGNTSLIKSSSEGSEFRTPPDLLSHDPNLEEMDRRTVSANSGNATPPKASSSSLPKTAKGWGI